MPMVALVSKIKKKTKTTEDNIMCADFFYGVWDMTKSNLIKNGDVNTIF